MGISIEEVDRSPEFLAEFSGEGLSLQSQHIKPGIDDYFFKCAGINTGYKGHTELGKHGITKETKQNTSN